MSERKEEDLKEEVNSSDKKVKLLKMQRFQYLI